MPESMSAVFMQAINGLFTSRGCYRCEASVHEAVVFHREWIVTKQMW